MVYHGPSGGCKSCRTRRIKCDKIRPQCNNCTRQRRSCPGYGDVFDGAHRNQNDALIRRMERQCRGRETRSHPNTPTDERSIKPSPSTSISSPLVSSSTSKLPLRWVIYSAPVEDTPGTEERTKSRPTIPDMVKQDPQEASICFFFRFYSESLNEPIGEPLVSIWEPLYLRSSSNSPLRLATAAVSVNIAMMWNFQGCDARPARRLYAKAISAMRQALSDPSTSTLDELIMTTLICAFYDAILIHFLPLHPLPGEHRHGAFALMKLRGASNFTTDTARELVHTTRRNFLCQALAWRTPLPPDAEQYFEHPTLTDSKVKQLDKLGILLANAQSHLWTLRRQRPLCKDFDGLRQSYEEVVAEATRIDELMAAWQRDMTDPEWMPQYVLREEVAPTIQAAGFYGDRCAIWENLYHGNIWNLFYEQRLLTLQMIRQVYADEPSLLESPKSRATLAWANSTMQALADAICETTPFYLGDTVVPTNPIYSHELNYPYKVMADQQTGRTIIIPSVDSDYKNHAAAKGGWFIYDQLTMIYRLMEPEDNAAPLVLREGQLDWVKGQIKRLQSIFLLCGTPWFKRPLLETKGTVGENTCHHS